jgi:arylsulfatase A-like enzyme
VPKIGREWAAKPVNLDTLQKIGQWKPVLRSYLASISFMDYNLGRVLKALDESAYRDNTIVVLWADNGFHMGEKHHFAKYALWEKTTRVLMMIRVPGMKTAGKVQQQPVNLLDIYPTLVELCDLQSPAQALDGISLLSLMEDENATREQPSVTIYQQSSVGIRSADWRYIRYGDSTEELYNEKEDPGEINNLASDPSYDQVKQNLSRWIPQSIQAETPEQP